MSTQYANPARPDSTLDSLATPGWWGTADGRFVAARVDSLITLVDTRTGTRFQVPSPDEAQRRVDGVTRREYLTALVEECRARAARDPRAAAVLAELGSIAAGCDSEIYWTVDADGTEWAVRR